MRKLLVLSCLSLAFAVGAAPPEQFRPELKGTRIYARGADDTKVVALAAAQILARLNGRASVGPQVDFICDFIMDSNKE